MDRRRPSEEAALESHRVRLRDAGHDLDILHIAQAENELARDVTTPRFDGRYSLLREIGFDHLVVGSVHRRVHAIGD